MMVMQYNVRGRGTRRTIVSHCLPEQVFYPRPSVFIGGSFLFRRELYGLKGLYNNRVRLLF